MSSCRLIVVKRFESTDLAQAFADKITTDCKDEVTINPEVAFVAVDKCGQKYSLNAENHYAAALEMLDTLGIKVVPETLN